MDQNPLTVISTERTDLFLNETYECDSGNVCLQEVAIAISSDAV